MESQIDLQELGLTKNESKAYLSILEKGKLGAGEISKFSGVSYSRIYDVLASLEQKGLIKLIPEKAKKFVPSNPEQLLEFVAKKEEGLKKFKDEIKRLKSLYDIKEKNPVILGYGKKAFYNLVKQQKKTEKYDYAIKWTSEYRPEWEASFKEHKKKGIEQKELVRFDKETEKNVKKWMQLGRKNTRILDNGGVAMSIKDDKEVLIALIRSDMTLLIKDEAFAKIMKKMFLETYKNAEEIK
ncbi:MAG: helix-turn-helix domain-containing protein [Nanoarchaeota archaeon]